MRELVHDPEHAADVERQQQERQQEACAAELLAQELGRRRCRHHEDDDPGEDDGRGQRSAKLDRPETPGDREGDVEGADDSHAEPDDEDDPGAEEVPAGVVLVRNCLHGRLNCRTAHPEVVRGVSGAEPIGVDPEAQQRCEHEPKRHQPEEEPVGEAAREQACGGDALTLERDGDQIGARNMLARPVVRAQHAAPGLPPVASLARARRRDPAHSRVCDSRVHRQLHRRSSRGDEASPTRGEATVSSRR